VPAIERSGPSQVGVAAAAAGSAGGAAGEAARGITAEAAIAQARAALEGELTATSPRMQRIAAAALARTGDPVACDVLAVQLGLAAREPRARLLQAAQAPPPPETSDIARLGLAYALARAGDKRGSDTLAAALGSPRGEARDEAARLLALLGDARAVPRLVDVLAVSQRRLGAAEHLAHLAEPHAIKVLEQIRGDAKTSADDRARAAIALGIAGHADVAAELHAMLDDPHFNAFAAAALAELKDTAARAVLERQLDSPSLRVRSARALRRLDPASGAASVLARLLDVLKAGRDTDQVQAAEAILLLAGPAAWSSYE
jgi:HEAT repeat protein